MQQLIGNCISFVAALFMAAGCLAKTRKKMFWYQFLECVILAVASVFFGSYAAVSTLLLSAWRNYLVSSERYSKTWMFLCLSATVVLGLITSKGNLLGMLPVLATVEYTLCSFYIFDVSATRISILVNVILWIIHSVIVGDWVTATTDTVVLLVDVYAMLREVFQKRQDAKNL